MYVGAPHGLIPVATGTNTPGKPIRLGARPVAIAFTPSGKTAYILDNRRSVITPRDRHQHAGQADQDRR